jgi:hypothetical protein
MSIEQGQQQIRLLDQPANILMGLYRNNPTLLKTLAKEQMAIECDIKELFLRVRSYQDKYEQKLWSLPNLTKQDSLAVHIDRIEKKLKDLNRANLNLLDFSNQIMNKLVYNKK